ncbi:unnamed protein product [Phaeothamnion confervicola]
MISAATVCTDYDDCVFHAPLVTFCIPTVCFTGPDVAASQHLWFRFASQPSASPFRSRGAPAPPAFFDASFVFCRLSRPSFTLPVSPSLGSGKNGFAVAVGVISLAVSGALLAAKIVGRTDLIQNMHTPISIFLFFWWVAGAGVGTFSGPFSATAYLNGYFSAWTAFLCAARYAYNVSDRFREYADRGANAMKSADPSLNNIHGGEGATV